MTQADPYYLSAGSHPDPQDGRCAMEFASYLAGEPHTAAPRCVSPTLTSFCIMVNDRLPDAERQKLRPYLARTLGTLDDGLDGDRVRLCRDWLLRVRLPRLLELAGVGGEARRLRASKAAFDIELLVVKRAVSAMEPHWDDLRVELPDDLYQKVYGDVDATECTTIAVASIATGTSRDEDYLGCIVAHCYIAIANRTDPAQVRDLIEALEAESHQACFELLDRMLPTVPLQLPVAPDADLVCQAPV